MPVTCTGGIGTYLLHNPVRMRHTGDPAPATRRRGPSNFEADA